MGVRWYSGGHHGASYCQLSCTCPVHASQTRLHQENYIGHIREPETAARETATAEEKADKDLPVEIPRLNKRLMDSLSTFSISKGLCTISIAQRRCIKVMLLKTSLTPKCPLKNLRKLKAIKKWVEEMKKKRKRPDSQEAGHLCRFCHLDLKHGPNSPNRLDRCFVCICQKKNSHVLNNFSYFQQ